MMTISHASPYRVAVLALGGRDRCSAMEPVNNKARSAGLSRRREGDDYVARHTAGHTEQPRVVKRVRLHWRPLHISGRHPASRRGCCDNTEKRYDGIGETIFACYWDRRGDTTGESKASLSRLTPSELVGVDADQLWCVDWKAPGAYRGRST
jgi:hypothetical protein